MCVLQPPSQEKLFLAFFFFNCAEVLSRVGFSGPLWTVVHQAPLSMGFPRQEYWNGLPFPLPGDLPNPGIEPPSPACSALASSFFTTEPPGKSICVYYIYMYI